MRNIDFKRGRNGEGQVVIDLSDPGAGIDLKQQGKTIIVELLQTELPIALERRFDVTDFGTPVDFMEVTSQGDSARMVIQAKGRWEQSAYQTDNRFIVEVKPMVEQPPISWQSRRPATPARSCRSTSRTWKCERCCR